MNLLDYELAGGGKVFCLHVERLRPSSRSLSIAEKTVIVKGVRDCLVTVVWHRELVLSLLLASINNSSVNFFLDHFQMLLLFHLIELVAVLFLQLIKLLLVHSLNFGFKNGKHRFRLRMIDLRPIVENLPHHASLGFRPKHTIGPRWHQCPVVLIRPTLELIRRWEGQQAFFKGPHREVLRPILHQIVFLDQVCILIATDRICGLFKR